MTDLRQRCTIALIFVALTVNAQHIYLGGGMGMGTFEMNSLKEFNQSIIKGLPFKPFVVDNFPPYYFFKGEALYCFPKDVAVGVSYSTTSTGSRLSLKDFSGNYTLDNQQKGYFLGLKVAYWKGTGDLNGFKLTVESGVAFSKMLLKEALAVADQVQKDDAQLNATGIYIQPGVAYFLKLAPRLRGSANISYFVGLENGYHVPFKKDQKLFDPVTQKQVSPQWDGIRLGLTAYWDFKKNGVSHN